MNHVIIADNAGVFLGDLESLSRGSVNANVANKLGVTIGDIESFIKGSATATMTKRLGFGGMISAVDELARVNGPDGAIGIIYGLLLSSSL